jgi:hypothetical protein
LETAVSGSAIARHGTVRRSDVRRRANVESDFRERRSIAKQGEIMKRKLVIRRMQVIAAATLALGTSAAFADDSSMSVLTGESYAYFNHLDYSLGKFNIARTADGQRRDAVVRMPVKPRDASKRAEKPIMLAEQPPITLRSPFRDDTGA